jgi:hypothetical protein
VTERGKEVVTYKIQIEVGIEDVEEHDEMTFEHGIRHDKKDKSSVFKFLEHDTCDCVPF